MIKYIMVPIIGAIIGYVTNWIAVKMLFRPHHEVYVFGIKLPFTPGVIPKGQGRLARAVGKAVNDQLLNQEVLSKVLLSDDMKEKLRIAVADWLKKEEQSEKTIKEVFTGVMAEERVLELTDSLKDNLTDTIYGKILSANLGKIVSDRVMEAIKEKLADSFLGALVGGSILDPIGEKVESRINEYVEENGRDHIQEMIDEEMDKLTDKTVGDLALMLKGYDIDLPGLVVSSYEKVVMDKLPVCLSAINLSAVVEDRINGMNVEEVEDLLLSIIKKELGAIVNLGALIGFVLGLINVAILLI